MAFTKRDKAAVKALVSCHETGKPVSNYSAFVVLNDDAGITFGAHQGTHKSGTLYKIVKMYCDVSDSDTSKKLEKYLSGLKIPSKRHEFAKDKTLKSLLIKSGSEPAMRFAQDKVFEVNYLDPALQAVSGSGWVTPLALAVVYDSMIQGGWTRVRDRVKGADEKSWIKNYVAARRKWLGSSSKQVVRNSVYRMTTFENLIAKGNWDLDVPFTVHGVRITNEHLNVWIEADTPAEDIVEEVLVLEPAPNFFIGNTEGIADDGDDSILENEDVEIQSEVTPNNEVDDKSGDQPKAGEPAPDSPAQEGEAIVGGRPQDPSIIIEQKKPEETGGWRTWSTTVTGFFGSLGVSLTAFGTWIWGALQDPTSSNFILVLGGATLILGGIFGIVYLIIRAMDKSRREKQAHEITLKEMEYKSNPVMYNVKVDRRSEPRRPLED